MSKKIEYEKKLQTQLDEFGTEIEKLKSRADKTEADAEPWHHKQIEGLQEKHKLAKEKLGELRNAGDDAWEDMKEGISSAWDSVSVALKSAAKRFK
jgi:predicted  nucleic acid-binding Zn-ribbon protein